MPNPRVRRDAFVALVGLWLAGCLPGDATGPFAQAVSESTDLIDTHDFSGKPGLAVVVAHRGRTVLSEARGLADVTHGVPVAGTTVFDWASVTKSVTAFAVALLADRGLVDLDLPVHRYLPSLGHLGGAITTRQLVRHTSGVQDIDGVLRIAGFGLGDDATLDESWRALSAVSALTSVPGAEFRYSNGGYIVLAKLLESVTGSTFDAWTRDNLFLPLGMHSARFHHAEVLVPHRARSYAARGDGSLYEVVGGGAPGPGGLLATAADMSTWANNYLASVSRHAGLLPALLATDSLPYGFGIEHSMDTGIPSIAHTGSGPGGQSHIVVFPDHDLTVIAASNSSEDPNVAGLAGRVADAFLAALGAEAAPDSTTGPSEAPRAVLVQEESPPPPESRGVRVDPSLLSSLQGTYEMDGGWLSCP